MVKSRTHNQKIACSSLGLAGIVGGGGVNVQRSLHLQYHDEVPLSKAEPPTAPRTPQHKMAAHCSGCVYMVCVCALLCVCAWMGKCRARIPSMGHHTWLYVTSLSLHFIYFLNITYFCDGSADLHQPLLQFSVLHDSLEIIII